jgi:glycopeptide antibiotics resistance protein
VSIANLTNRVGWSTYVVMTVIIATAMLYLELYPFKFRVPANGHGAVRKFFQTWADRAEPGDFIRNVAAYIALSFCATMALGYYGGRLRWACVVVLFGTATSISFELTQYFIPGRYTSAIDVYADILGLVIGSALAVVMDGELKPLRTGYLY